VTQGTFYILFPAHVGRNGYTW